MITNPILPGFNPDPSIVRVGDEEAQLEAYGNDVIPAFREAVGEA